VVRSHEGGRDYYPIPINRGPWKETKTGYQISERGFSAREKSVSPLECPWTERRERQELRAGDRIQTGGGKRKQNSDSTLPHWGRRELLRVGGWTTTLEK